MTPTARGVAADVLARADDRQGFAADLVDDALGRTPLEGQDRRFVTNLVFGVTRRQATLDALLTPFLKTPLYALERRVHDVLRLGAFQLAFLPNVPRHAAVHETVDLAEYVGSPQASGLVNGVLRRVSELVTDEFVEYAGPDTLPFDATESTVPPPPGTGQYRERGGVLRKGSPDKQMPLVVVHVRFRKLAQAVLPNPDEDTAGYLTAGFSWPDWLADRWLRRHGREEAFRLGFWFNNPPPLWVRVNKLHSDRETYRLRLAADQIDVETGGHPQSLRVLDGVAVRELPGYADGDFAVQDEASMRVASALSPQPGMRVLDLCAAPGGKTTHLCELMDNRGTVVACDIDPKRLDTVRSLVDRMKVKTVETVLLGEHDDPPAGPFHAALVDAPCSNTGVLGRRPEVRWRIKPTEFEYLIRLQTRLLIQAVERVKAGGTVVYSTCSIEPDENAGVVAAVRRAFPKLTLEAEHTAIPGRPSDGGYWARLRKGT